MPGLQENIQILLIEDNPGDRRLVLEELRDTSYSDAIILEAECLEQASALVRSNQNIVLVFLDLNLPDSSGLSSIQYVRNLVPNAALVVLTGMSDHNLALQALRLGVQTYLVKSDLTSAVLERTIRFSIERTQILNELRESNQQLVESKELLEAAQEAAKIGNWSVELFGSNRMTCSRETKQIFGIPQDKENVTSNDLFASCHPDDRTMIMATVESAVDDMQPFSLQYRLQREDGSIRWIQTRARAMRDEVTDHVVLVGISQDITDQKGISDRLLEHEEILQLVSEFASDVIGLHDLDGQFTYVSQAVTRFLGFETSELIGVKWTQIVHPSEVKEVEYQIDMMIRRNNFDRSITYRVRQKSGDYIWCETKFRPVSSFSRGESKFVTVTRDVTARLASEEQIRLFSRAVEQSADLIFLCSVNRTIVYANDSACTNLKHSRSHFLGETLHIMVEQDHQLLLEQAYAFAFSNGSCVTELNFCRADDSTFPAEVSMSAIYNDAEEISGLMCSVHDITDRKQTEKRLREFTRELEVKVDERTKELNDALAKEKELSELKTRFMSMVSHEFRTPLTVILSSTQLLQRYSARMTDAQRGDHYATVQREIAHLVTMLNDVMTLGRSGSVRLHTKIELIPIDGFLTELEMKVKAVDQGHHAIAFKNTWGRDNVRFDENLMSQVMMNVLGNAIKYSAPQSEIDVSLRDRDGEFEIEVKDHGIGIPKKDIVRLFEPFHRADNVGTVQGTGLGMAIVQEYVSLHRGTINVDSDEGQGTTVTIRLPQ